MEKISTLFLRRELTRVLERLEAGESFLLTHRGKVIAALQPIGIDAPRVRMGPDVRSGAIVDAVSPRAQPPGSVGKISPLKSSQQLRDELLRGVRSGKPGE